MTGHIDRDELRKLAMGASHVGATVHLTAETVLGLLDALDEAEVVEGELREKLRTAIRFEADARQEAKDERGAALDALEQLKLLDERIKAVRDVLDQEAPEPHIATRVRADTIRRALDGAGE